MTATKAADNDYNAVSSQSTTVSIAQAPQSITFTSQPPAQPQVGGGYTVAATADSGLPVAFSIDPASDTGVCSKTGAVVSFTAAGVCIIDANQAGNGNYLASALTEQKGPSPHPLPASRPVRDFHTRLDYSRNHFVDPPRYKARRNGWFVVSVKVSGPGRVT